MNITKNDIDELNAVLNVKIEKEDYQERVDKILRDYRKNARIDGFRPGKVPQGLIRKMYWKPVMADEINKILSEEIGKYLVNEKLRILGEPMPSEDQPSELDFDTQTEFDFAFDLGLAPEFEMNISSKDKVPYYEIKIDKKVKDSYVENVTQRFGAFKTAEKMGEKSMLKGSLEQVDETGALKENGISVQEASISVDMIHDDAIQKNFLASKIDDSLIFDIKRAFPNDTEITSLLNIQKSELETLEPMFRYTVKVISNFEPAEINQELYDKVYGKDVVKSDEEFMQKIEEEIQKNLEQESNFRFQIDATEKLIQKSKIDLPNEFLRKWLYRINEGKYTPEQIDDDYDHFNRDLKWQLIRDKIAQDNGFEVKEEEILELAKQVTLQQFMQYGLSNVPDEQLENYAREMLKKEEDKKRLYERKLEEKVYTFIRESVKLDRKKVSSDDFNKLYEKDKKQNSK